MKRELGNKKNDKLAKLRMPEKKQLSLLDLAEEEKNESPEEEAAESPEEQSYEEEMGLEEAPSDEHAEQASNPELETASDDDLLAEVRKRGLMSQLQGHMSPEEEQA